MAGARETGGGHAQENRQCAPGTLDTGRHLAQRHRCAHHLALKFLTLGHGPSLHHTTHEHASKFVRGQAALRYSRPWARTAFVRTHDYLALIIRTLADLPLEFAHALVNLVAQLLARSLQCPCKAPDPQPLTTTVATLTGERGG